MNTGISSRADSGLYAAGGIFSAQAASEVNTALMGTATGGQNAFGGEFIARSAADTSFGLRAYGRGGFRAIGGFFKANSSDTLNIGSISIANGTGAYQNIGGKFEAEGSSLGQIGVLAHANGTGAIYNNGIIASATGSSTNNAGGYFTAAGTGTNNYGVSAVIGDTLGTYSYAVYGQAPLKSDSQSYAGYFSGDLVYTNNLYQASDENLKTNITDLDVDKNLLYNLKPKSYNLRTDEYPQINLARGKQYGLLAQDVEKVLPEAVRTIHHPAQYDSLGNEISPAVDYKAINYTMLIPVLIQAMQSEAMTVDSIAQANQALETENGQLRQSVNELNTQVASMQASLTDMQTILNSYDARLREIEDNCCESGTLKSGSIEGSGEDLPTDITAKVVTEETELYQNRPNPFREYTEFSYKLGQGGMVSLEVYNASGQLIETLVSENQESGQYKVDWNTTDIQPGVYLYALKINGLTWVKKAIRIP